ncbi:ferrous iron transport protein B [Draconibacterium orientale]|uniref:Ferrous iron transport protein B n=1 Tax=Draconibacterium orientale TaxID=1168034 RepID=X5DH05_9BACT|nr:ferrous iron transport protein B [Draconibacterium orientale]AHW60344.1 ferrous iron transporter B [Draconibacterium orientale]SET96109.1 ferrous iron transport protein B [Draconibacterium orientale]
MKLSEARNNEPVVITKVLGHGSFRKRITEMGFIRGNEVRAIKNSPFKGPSEYKILNYNITLRKSEADRIEVIPASEFKKTSTNNFEGTIDRNIDLIDNSVRTKTINIALVGNPNCGKTTLFNFISGSKEKVGNYSGVTVDIHKATFKNGDYTFNFYDLPGTYSLTAYSKEEIFVRKFIYEQTPDIVINVLDSTNLERSLFLTTQLIDMDLRVIMALNMFDELEKNKLKLDKEELSKLVGIPLIPTVSSKGLGLDSLIEKVIEVFEGRDNFSRHIHINYGKELEQSIRTIRQKIKEDKPITDKISSRFLAIKLIEKDNQVIELLSKYSNFDEIQEVTLKEIKKIEQLENDDSETVIANAKYSFIAGALRETYSNKQKEKKTQSEKIDSVLTNRYLGFPIFTALLFFIFWTTFKLGAYPMDWIDAGVVALGNFVGNIIPDGMLNDLLVDGIIGGAGSVVIFLPNILILFFFISLLEGSGYMARAAFIMDNIMHRFGLHGRSFIPMIMGFGCNVPAILATRSMRNRGDRILTMLIIPFMSCSARLPVYILIISAFFQKYEAWVLIGIYAVGILFAFITAQVLNKTVFKNKETPFVMELPTYRLPTFRNVVYHMWDKTQHYLKKIGTIILLGVIIIWALEYFPRKTKNTAGFEQQIEQIINSEIPETQKEERIAEVNHAMESDRLINSYIGRTGKFIQPIMSPLGFDWKMSIAIVAGLPAKEIVVSTMGVLYQTQDGETTINLQQKLQNEVHQIGKHKGQAVFTTPAALAFIIFILLYFPCIGVVATIKNESGSWKWAAFSVFYTTALAWIAAFVTYNIGMLFM